MSERRVSTDARPPNEARAPNERLDSSDPDPLYKLEITASDLLGIIRQGEREEVEFKRSLDLVNDAPASVERTVAGLANSAVDEVSFLIFGVEDAGEIVGLTDRSGRGYLAPRVVRTRRQQFSQLVSRIRPKVDYSWNIVSLEGHVLVVIRIRGRTGQTVFRTSSAETPYRQDSHTFYADAELIDAWRNAGILALANDLEGAVKEWKVRSKQLYSARLLFPRSDVTFRVSLKALPGLRRDLGKSARGPLIHAGQVAVENPRLIIYGSGGAGKSFLLRWMAFRTVRSTRLLRTMGLPLYLQLHRYRNSLIDLLIDSCSLRIAPLFSTGLWVELLRKYDCCLLLDGLSECDDPDAVLRDLQSLWRLNHRLRVVIATRSLVGLSRYNLEKALDFKIFGMEPLSATQLPSFVRQFGALSPRDSRVASIVDELLTKLQHCPWEVIPLGLGYAGHPLTMSLVVLSRLPGTRSPTDTETIGELYKRTWIDDALATLGGTVTGKRSGFAWLRLKTEVLGAIASRMCAGARPEIELSEPDVLAAADSTLIAGRRNYKNLRDELLEELILIGILIPSARGVVFYHETLRDFFWAQRVLSEGRQGWDGLLLNLEAHASVAFLCGLLQNPYVFLDYVYERARYESRLAAYLAVGLEHGKHLHDRNRNLEYLEMIFFYREGAQYLGPRSLPHIRSFLSVIGGPARHLTATQRYLELTDKGHNERRTVLEECFTSNWPGRWALIRYLPDLGVKRMANLAGVLFFEASSNERKLTILRILSEHRSGTVLRFFKDLGKSDLNEDERRLMESVLARTGGRRSRLP